jgi:hypothetical protein
LETSTQQGSDGRNGLLQLLGDLAEGRLRTTTSRIVIILEGVGAGPSEDLASVFVHSRSLSLPRDDVERRANHENSEK